MGEEIMKELYESFLSARTVRQEQDLAVLEKEIPEITLEEMESRMKRLGEGELLRMELPAEW